MKEKQTNSIIPLIETQYNEFTDAEKRVADYFLKMEAEENLQAKEVAKKNAVSEATLSRFAKKLGFTGYREFQFHFKSSFTVKTKVEEANHKAVLLSYQELLNKVYAIADEQQLLRIAKQIQSSHRVFFAGRGNSGLAAEEIATRFRWLGVEAGFIRDSEAMQLEAIFINERDVVIGLSVGGDKPEVLKLLKSAGANGAKTFLFTGNSNKRLQGFCDEVVLVPSIEYLNNGNLISPQFPLLMFGDMLYASFVDLNSKKMKRTQQLVQQIFREGQV